ncbi:hypothetical protein [Amycolatopsis sp. NPDC098790]|uniref:hypothetical protein n=1 Tax=Amycolatopsis sp. NPDC098790 TaxID=3363939 RepID=UPI00382EABB5
MNLASNEVPSWVHKWSWPALGVLAVLSMGAEYIRLREEDGRGEDVRLRDAAEALALAVSRQWSGELSRLLTATALPQQWSTTDRPVLPPPAGILGPAAAPPRATVLRRLFRRGLVRGRGDGPILDVLHRASARGELDFDGDLDDLATLILRLPHQQVIVLGELGAGKSVLAARLTLSMCGTRASGDPVPVLLSLTSWRVGAESPQEWIKRRLRTDYGPGDIERLVDAGHVFAVLDGLDELPRGLHAEALRRLGKSGLAMVVTSRAEEYQTAVEETGEVPATALVVELRAIERADAVAYLAAGRVNGDSRWAPVFARLRNGSDSALAQALRTPLMIDLARAADPERLLGLSTPAEVEEFLLDGLIPAAYPEDQRDAAGRALRFLAGHLLHQETYDFRWWRLRQALSSPARAIGIGIGAVAAALSVVAVWLMVLPTVADAGAAAGLSLAAGCLAGVLAGAIAATTAVSEPQRTYARVGGRWIDLIGRLSAGVVRGTVAGVVIGAVGEVTYWLAFETSDSAHPALLMGAAAGAVTGMGFGLLGWLQMTADSVQTVGPAAVLRADRTVKLVQLAVFGLPFGLAAGLVFGLVAGPFVGLVDGAGAALIGAVVGLARGPHVWTGYQVARLVLAGRGRVPWRLMGFLAEAHRLGVLRANGGAYRFRHNLLQDRMAGGAPPARSAEPLVIRPGGRSRVRHAAALTSIVLLLGASLGIGLPVAGGLQARCGLTPFDQDVRYLAGGFTYECVGVTDGAYDFTGADGGVSSLIEKENESVVAGPDPYVRVALLAPLAPGVFTRQQIVHALQGVFLAQQHANAVNTVKVELVLANEGRNQAHWRPVIDQLVRMAGEEHPLVAVVGLGVSTTNSVQGVQALARRGIPMVAATANALHADGLFRITPDNQEFAAALRRSWPGQGPDYVLSDGLPDVYVESLRKAFLSTWHVPEVWNGGRMYLPGCPSGTLYAGRSSGLTDVADYLTTTCPGAPVTVGSVSTGRPELASRSAGGAVRVICAISVDPVGWSAAPQRAPAAFEGFREEYAGRFGEPLNDGFALLYHDAAAAAFTAIKGRQPTAETVRETLPTVEVQGATGTFRFNRTGDPVGRPIPVITEPGSGPDPHPYLSR